MPSRSAISPTGVVHRADRTDLAPVVGRHVEQRVRTVTLDALVHLVEERQHGERRATLAHEPGDESGDGCVRLAPVVVDREHRERDDLEPVGSAGVSSDQFT
jgi:hypothetical protein